MTPRRVRIAVCTFLVLYLELMLIRWLGSEIKLFSYFKNFVLMAAFLGFGLGCLRPVPPERSLRFLPYIFLVQAAFAKAWGRGFALDNISLKNFHFVLFEHATAAKSVWNAFVYAGVAATLGVIITLGVAYIVTRKLVPFGGFLGFLCVAPFVIPGVVLAIGFYAAYAPPPLALYGTATILILAFTTRFLPIGYVNASAAMRALNPEMEEAVRVLGGSRLTALRRVVAPLLKRSLLGAWLLIFIPATRELSAAIFLYGPNTKVASVMIFDMSEEGNFEYLAALALILQVLTLPLLWIGQKALGRDFMLRRTAT